MEQKIITHEAYDKLAKELQQLKQVRLPEITDKIEKAKELGDLSENAEYHDAKDEQGMVNARVREIESILKTAVVQAGSKSKDVIGLGSTFTASDESGADQQFTIVSFNEADPLEGRISNESPMGGAFMHRKIGETVEVETPRGVKSYTVKSID